ncbi:membrane protein [Sulfuricaulis limicola]|uniref:Probable membrane transporter protein n=1 Tax=Sulfuricaulis limicola TaxID=1620215 RepID=A0A1B4XGU6_9GAMM|nr:sulfite exporter TauE/SafE family protein [Sulfuricaulis limicola]BAV34042.1 membrane protein [Sulfuricaulis limicola]
METLLIYLVVGAFVGLIAGLLGVGGGLIIVPVLVFVFQGQGVSPEVIVHLAIGTSLATIAITSISSMRAHHRHGAVQWDVFRRLTPGIVVGALLGAVIADFLPTKAMRLWFGVFELLVAAQIGFNLMVAPRGHLPGSVGTNIAGGVIGAISAALGIGGGTLTTPFLVWCNFSLRQAVATSSACGLPIALAGAAGFVATGWNNSGLPEWSSGYLYWPAFAGIVVSSLLFAPLGAKLTHTLPVTVLRRFFAVFLAVLGVRMLIG